MGFRMTVLSATAQKPNKPHTKLDCFPLQDQTEAETVAFGYRARALVFEQRVRRTFGYPRHAPFHQRRATVSHTNSPARTFVPV
jgi:hypothetical protein